MVDYRKEWIKNRVLTFLDEKNSSLFDQLCLRHGGKIGRKLTEYLEDRIIATHDIDKKIFIVYKTYYDKVIHEEVLVAEKVERAPEQPEPEPEAEEDLPASPTSKKIRGKKGKSGSANKGTSKLKSSIEPPDPLEDGKLLINDSAENKQVEDTTEEEPMTEGEDDIGKDAGQEKTVTIVDDKDNVQEKKSAKKGKKQKKKGRKSPPTVMETLPTTEEEVPPPEPEIIYVKKIIEKVVKTPQLHGHFGALTKYDVSKKHRFVYFVRKTSDGIPCPDMMQEAFSEMPEHFQVGCTTGDLLRTLIHLIPGVYMPLVSHQFLEPHMEEIGDENLQESDRKGPPVQTVFYTPSDYRQMALDIKRELEREEGYPVDDDRDDDDSGIDLDMALRQREHMTRDSLSGVEVLVYSALPPIHTSTLISSTCSEQEVIKQGLLTDLQKLLDSSFWTLEHISGSTMLTIPQLPELSQKIPVEVLAEDKDIIQVYEKLVAEWELQIIDALRVFTSKKPSDEGPIAEYEYWHEREIGLGVLVEQLKNNSVMAVLNVLNTAESAKGTAFTEIKADVLRSYIEARDNDKFLYTILRYFKTISASENFQEITDCLPSLFGGLQMIWILSRYYSNDNAMVPLLQRIKFVLCSQVKDSLAVYTLFKQPLSQVMKKTNGAVKMLVKWKNSYLETRMKIEASAKSHRWEFDKRKLFAETDYLASVANNLNCVANVIYCI